MKRFTYVGGMAVILGWLLLSCQSDQPTSPLPHSGLSLNVQITHLDSIINATEGELCPIAFEVIVTDDSAIPVPEAQVMIEIATGPGNVAPGAALSNQSGIVNALYYLTMPFGDTTATIRAYAGDDTAEFEIEIYGDPAPSEIQLSVSPETFRLNYAESCEGTLTATVLDKRGNGVPDQNVAFNIVNGQAEIENFSSTDDQGMVNKPVSLNGYWFGELSIRVVVLQAATCSSIDESEDFPVWLDILGLTPKEAQRVQQIASGSRVIADTLSVPVIRASYVGLQILPIDSPFANYSSRNQFNVIAQLGDEYGLPISDATIEFRADPAFLTIQPAMNTDANGIATASVDLTGEASITNITAVYEPHNLIDSVMIEILDRPPTTVTFDLLDHPSTVWVDSTYIVRVTVRSDDGEPTVGVETCLISEIGMIENRAVITDQNGEAIHTYAPENGGAESMNAIVVDFDLIGQPLEFMIYQEPMDFEGELIEVDTEHRQHFYDYQFRITDTNGFGVPNEEVTFDITLGRLSDELVVTGEDGHGRIGIHWEGRTESVAEMNIKWRDLENNIPIEMPFDSRFAQLKFDLDTHIMSPSGSGAMDTTARLTFWVEDYDGNILHNIPATAWVRTLNDSPQTGISINGKSEDTLHTENGIGSGLFIAGTGSSSRSFCITMWLDELSIITCSSIILMHVRPGPPAIINIDVNGEGVSQDGGIWAIEVAARIFDRNTNPIDYILVRFSCDSMATIDEEAWTNNGIAYTQMTYNSLNTFDTLTITAEVQGPNGVVQGERQYTLPLQEGVMELHCYPTNWLIDENPDVEIRCWVELRDGHEVLINNAPILFTSNRGFFSWYDHQDQEFVDYDYMGGDYPIKYTGWRPPVHPQHRENRGQATVFLGGQIEDFIPDPVTPEINIQVSAEVVGYEDVVADPVIVVITRHP
ncbi:MAG: Ig-like domain-containing protein [Candidatus Hatepunaea meridiana]|nr:Ig-like domain-containing protein [Candidatus Hatepunaea meridiana]